MDKVECLCPSCNSKFNMSAKNLLSCLADDVELEGGVISSVENFEELRLTLQSFMKKEVLDSLLSLYRELDKEPRQIEMYSWFVRNSQYGGECRFALAALKKFKEARLDRFEDLLRKCISSIEEAREDV